MEDAETITVVEQDHGWLVMNGQGYHISFYSRGQWAWEQVCYFVAALLDFLAWEAKQARRGA